MPAARMSQDVLEALTVPTGKARVAQDVIEVLYGFTAGAAPAGSFGVAMSQRVVEVLIAVTADVRVAQDVIEVLYSPSSVGESGTVGGGSSTVSYPVVA